MKEKLLIAGILVFSLSVFSQEKKAIKSKLNDVTVFFQGAELTHTASSLLTKGENEIVIEGLSPNIDRNSLKIKASNGVLVSSYEYSVDFLSENKSPNPQIKKLEDSIQYYNSKLETVNTEISVNQGLQNLLTKGIDKNVSGSEKGLGIDELVKTMDYYKAKSTELSSSQYKNNKLKQEYALAIGRLKRQLDQESLKNNKAVGVLTLNLSSPLATNCNFTLSYYTTAARWTPFYDINIASTDKPIKIEAKSKVSQTTGVDWTKVKLTLSTATPSDGKTAPLFNAWFLNYITPFIPSALAGKAPGVATQNSYSYRKMESNEKSAQLDEIVVTGYGVAKKDNNTASVSPLIIVDGNLVDVNYLNSIDPSKVKTRETLDPTTAASIYGSQASNGAILVTLKNSMDDYVSQQETDLNIIYNIDLPYSIPGNGKEQTIDLLTKETTAEYKYYCAPKLDTETYLLAEISDWAKLNLLSGKANITYDGTYVGESFIDARSTNEKLALTLGADKRVSVKREKLQDFSSTKTFGNDIKQVLTYKLTVKNNQNKAIKMVLKDQYPLSTQKSIEVELLTKETTPWTTNRDDLGVITWEETLNAGETKSYTISYSVKYPKDKKINL